MEIVNLYDLGLRFFHDPDLHHEATNSNSTRVDPSTGTLVMYLGMKDILVDGERTRRKIEITQGPPLLILEPIDKDGARDWDGVVSMAWEPNGTYAEHDQNCISDPEKISKHYNVDTAVTNDGTIVRTSLVFALDDNVKFVIKKDGGADRMVSAFNTTSVVLNQNEYICSVVTTSGPGIMNKIESGRDNAIKITMSFDLAYDFSNSERGVNLTTMSDAIANETETRL